jgi:nitrous oxide reductase accessory protein NosL
MRVSRLLLLCTCLPVLLFAGCAEQQSSGPSAVKWDRDTCARCRMVLSDRDYAAQVRYSPDARRTRVALFDDIGCAILWLEDKPWRDAPQTEIWVVDELTGNWIDAREATYVPGRITPMEYGLGARAASAAGGLNFAEAKRHVIEVEQRFDRHGLHLMKKFKQQAEQREAERKARTAEEKLPPIVPEKE